MVISIYVDILDSLLGYNVYDCSMLYWRLICVLKVTDHYYSSVILVYLVLPDFVPGTCTAGILLLSHISLCAYHALGTK